MQHGLSFPSWICVLCRCPIGQQARHPTGQRHRSPAAPTRVCRLASAPILKIALVANWVRGETGRGCVGARSRENGPKRDPLHTTHINFTGTQFLRHRKPKFIFLAHY